MPECDVTIDGAFSYCNSLTAINWPSKGHTVTLHSLAFSNCNGLAEVVIPDNVVAGERASAWFQYCTNLKKVTLPPTLKEIPQYCFNNCSSLTDVTMAEGIERVGNYAFGYCSKLEEMQLASTINYIGAGAYSGAGMKHLTVPEFCEKIEESAFSDNPLETITFNERLRTIGDYAFQSYQATLTELNLPAELDTIGNNAFANLSKLETVNAGTKVGFIGNYAFSYCSSLKNIAFHTAGKTLRTGSSLFSSCTALEDVTLDGDSLRLGDYALAFCNALKQFTSAARQCDIGRYAFNDSKLLETVTFSDPDFSIGNIGDYAFYNCSSLKEFPYFASVTGQTGNSVFQNCSLLRQMEYPAEGPRLSYDNDLEKSWTWTASHLYDCSSLQSVTFHSFDRYFGISGSDIQGAPLKGVSHYVGGNPHVAENPEWWWGQSSRMGVTTMKIFSKPGYGPELATGAKLYVGRGQKWKFHEAGYDVVFDIMERKEPKPVVTGDVFSEFDREKNVNHYKVILSLDVQLGDLNADGPTKFYVKRDSTVNVLTGEFSKPELIDVTGYEGVDKAYRVGVTVLSGTANPSDEMKQKNLMFSGSYDYRIDDGSLNSTKYRLTATEQKAELLFDAVTWRRIDTFDKYSDFPPFIFVEEFDSPNLADEYIPMSYIYTASLEVDPYTVLVNNEGYEAGEDGLYYHSETRPAYTAYSAKYPIYTGMAMPSINFPGIMTREQALADVDMALPATQAPAAEGNFYLTYQFPGSLARHYGYDPYTCSEGYIVQKITGYELDPASAGVVTPSARRRAAAYADKYLGSTAPAGQSEGQFSAGADADLAPGTRYQLVTETSFRGTFGSPVLTMPGMPILWAFNSFTDTNLAGDEHAGHDAVAASRITFYYDHTPVGYAENPRGEPDTEQWFAGIWRSVDPEIVAYSDEEDSPADPGTLVYHSTGLVEQKPDCSACRERQKLDFLGPDDPENMQLNDVYTVEPGRDFTGTYSARMYVKVPAVKLRNDNAWMAVDASLKYGANMVVLGVEDVAAERPDEGPVRWFNLSGMEVRHPVPGQIYIRVTSSKTDKVIFN